MFFGTVNKNAGDEHPFCTIDLLYHAKSYETVQAKSFLPQKRFCLYRFIG